MATTSRKKRKPATTRKKATRRPARGSRARESLYEAALLAFMKKFRLDPSMIRVGVKIRGTRPASATAIRGRLSIPETSTRAARRALERVKTS